MPIRSSHFNLSRYSINEIPDEAEVKDIISSLDDHDRWLIRNLSTSNPYIGDGKKQELTDHYASTNVGDETDTSPYRDTSDQQYISTWKYIRNMNLLVNFINHKR